MLFNSSDLEFACARAHNQGVFVVASTGNDGGGVLYPAAYASTFAVAAVDGEPDTTRYSGAGPEVDIAAPGGLPAADAWNDGWPDGILGCYLDETVASTEPTHVGVVGTSQAAPHVSAAAALMLSLDPTLLVSDLRAFLRGSALDLGVVGEDVAFGAGLLQIHRALNLVLKRLGTPRSDAPRSTPPPGAHQRSL